MRTHMILLSYENAEKLFLKKKYRFFKSEYNLNIFAVRAASRKIDEFDDTLCVAYEENKQKKIFCAPCTVDPGLPWRLAPMEPTLGAAAIKEGQYLSVWELGFFRSTPALLQVGPFVCYRDNDRNEVFDYQASKTSAGLYGIHLHEHFQPVETATKVDRSSAGCIVPASRKDFYAVINLCRKQIAAGWGRRFSFTLFDEKELQTCL
jgi:hypothetical protein